MKKVLVTGGAGFIGSHIADKFHQIGAEVHIVDNLSTGLRENLPSYAGFSECDICSPELKSIISSFQPELVVHAAAQVSVRVSMQDPAEDIRVNVEGISNLLGSLPEQPPFVVFLSTGGAIYGEQDEFPADETHAIRPTSLYGLNKFVGEQYLSLWKRTRALPHGVLRLANVYGPRQNPHGEAGVVAIFSERLLSGKSCTIFGDGSQTRDFVHAADVVSAVELMALKRYEGILNVGLGEEVSVNDLYAALSSSLGIDREPEYGEPRAGEQQRSCIDASLLRRELGWAPRFELASGLKNTAEWYRERGPQ